MPVNLIFIFAALIFYRLLSARSGRSSHAMNPLSKLDIVGCMNMKIRIFSGLGGTIPPNRSYVAAQLNE